VGYVRADDKCCSNRLWIVSKVRCERTADEGADPLNDIRNTYAQAANGDLVGDAAGRLIPITTESMQQARLPYTLKESPSKKKLRRSLSKHEREFLADSAPRRARRLHAEDRPAQLPRIIPSVAVSDPDAITANKIITVINSALQPWSADNYDLSFEVDEVRVADPIDSLSRKA
jgi:hypothetical protein